MTLNFEQLISADSHVMEPKDLWWNTLGKRYGDHTPRVLDEHLGKKGSFFYTGRQVLKMGQTDHEAQKIGFQEAGFVPEVRVEFQKQAGVTAEILNATFMLLIMQGRYQSVNRACAAVFNDWLAEFCSHDPERLVGVAMIPMDDIDWACAELDRGAKRGLKGAIINLMPPEGSLPYRDRAYDPFWARAEEIEFPLTLHIITGRIPDPLHFHTREEQGQCASMQIALMYEIMGVLANEFIFGQILDRFPRLKLVCSEFEISWIPPFMWRLDQMQEDFGYRLDLAEARAEGERLHAPADLARRHRRSLRGRIGEEDRYRSRDVGVGFPPCAVHRPRRPESSGRDVRSARDRGCKEGGRRDGRERVSHLAAAQSPDIPLNPRRARQRSRVK